MLFHMHARKNILDNLKDLKETIHVFFQYFGRINFRYDDDSVIRITSLPLFETTCGHFRDVGLTKLNDAIIYDSAPLVWTV